MGVGFFQRLKSGLNRAHQGFVGKIDGILSRFTKLDPELFDELEAALIEADIGPRMSWQILEDIRARAKQENVKNPGDIKGLLQNELIKLLPETPPWHYNPDGPTVFLIVGVNGVGKTTTIAKMARYFLDQKKTVLLAAADTFRAAAIDQLKIWAERLKLDCIAHQDGADAAAVCFDAVTAAKARGIDVLLIDTAGRLHTKSHLVEELKKIQRTIGKVLEGAPHETLLVLDATTGQNGLYQAEVFSRELTPSGIVLAKLDGTAKGGIALIVSSELGLPIRLIGVGEKPQDLADFDREEFVNALFAD